MNTFKVIARWVLVLPASIGAYFAVQFLIILVDATLKEGNADWYLQLINSAAGAYGFVWVGGKVAPRAHFVVGVVLAACFVLFALTLAALGFVHGLKSMSPWWLALNSVVGAAAAVAACFQLKELQHIHDLTAPPPPEPDDPY